MILINMVVCPYCENILSIPIEINKLTKRQPGDKAIFGCQECNHLIKLSCEYKEFIKINGRQCADIITFTGMRFKNPDVKSFEHQKERADYIKEIKRIDFN